MRPDLLATWPTNCDYPLWRRWLCEERRRFAKVIVIFSPHPGLLDYRQFVRARLADADVEFLDAPGQGEWRDVAVNAALDRSDAEWVWFTEQDFLIHEPFFWRVVGNCETHGARMIGIKRDERWHPCCLFVKREDVERTPRYFGPEPVDHFWSFGEALVRAGVPKADLDAWLRDDGAYTHLAGLSRNHQIIDGWKRGSYPLSEELYHPEQLASYLERCLAEGSSGPSFAAQARIFLAWYSKGEPFEGGANWP